MAVSVSVVIVSYNRKRCLEKCLECLLQQDYPEDDYEIIVVDDGSIDGTREMVQAMSYSGRVRYFFNPQRLGQSKARNKGILEAQGEVIIFMDSDAFAPPWFIREHVIWHQKDHKLIVDGPAINVSGEDYLREPPFDSPLVKILAFFDFWGASFVTVNTSCRKENLIKVGGFDEDFGRGFGWQDRELGFRLKNFGLKRVKNRKAYVLHYRAERNDLVQLAEKRKDRGENAVLYYRKHPLPSIKREVRFHYLFYDRLFKRFGLKEKYLNLNYLNKKKKGLLFYLLKKLYLIQSYAEGLKVGMHKYNVNL